MKGKKILLIATINIVMVCILAHSTCVESWLKCQLNLTDNFFLNFSFIVQVKSCTFDEFQGISTVLVWWRQIVCSLMEYVLFHCISIQIYVPMFNTKRRCFSKSSRIFMWSFKQMTWNIFSFTFDCISSNYNEICPYTI